MFRTNLLAAAAALAISATLSVSAAQAHYATQLKQGPDGLYHVNVSEGVFLKTAMTATSLTDCAVGKNVTVTQTDIIGTDNGGNPIYGGHDSFLVPEGATFQVYTLRDGVPAKQGLASVTSIELKGKGCSATISLPAQ